MPLLLILTLSVLAFSVSAQTPQTAPNFKGRPLLNASTKVLEKAAIKKVKPVAPVGVTVSGVASVQVWIDPIDGKVLKAKVVSGHPLLRESALKAARQWVWKEVECLNGLPPIVVGVLNFDFPKK
jgi:hypothetical protein